MHLLNAGMHAIFVYNLWHCFRCLGTIHPPLPYAAFITNHFAPFGAVRSLCDLLASFSWIHTISMLPANKLSFLFLCSRHHFCPDPALQHCHFWGASGKRPTSLTLYAWCTWNEWIWFCALWSKDTSSPATLRSVPNTALSNAIRVQQGSKIQ